MCYRLVPYREPCGKVNEKTRHISSLHFLVLFLACQTASPVKAKLHFHSAPCIPKYSHLNVCAHAQFMHIQCRFVRLYVCPHSCVCVCVCEGQRIQCCKCRVAVADSRLRLMLLHTAPADNGY